MSVDVDVVMAATAAACGGRTLRESDVGATVDWARVHWLAGAHHVVPLVFEGIGSAAPDPVRTRLHDDVLQHSKRALHMSALLTEILDTLTAAGLRALAVKGPALGVAVYGHATRRTFADLDLWVARADLTRAADVLARAGFALDARLADAARRPSRFVQATLNLVRDRVVVEIHGEAHVRFVDHVFDFDQSWVRRREVVVGGSRVATLDAVDTLHYVCLHGTVHAWERLQWIADVAMAARACDEAAARALVARADRAGHARLVRVALRLAGLLDHAPLATSLVACADARDPQADALVSRVRVALARDTAILRGSERFLFHVRSRQGRARRHYLLWCGLTASAADVAEAGLHPRLSWMYPLWRVPRLLARYGRSTSPPATRA